MSRALRRHPIKQGKRARGKGGAPALPRPGGGARAAPRREGRSGLAGVLSWRPRFAMDIISELRKVVWPTRQDAMYLTFVVVVVAVLIGAVLGGIDIGFGWLVEQTLLR